MKVEIVNQDKLRESVPIEIKISELAKAPKVVVKEMGTVEVSSQRKEGQYQAVFWVMKAGEYSIEVESESGSWEQTISVAPQEYISFKQEFGFFIIIFCMVSLGLVLWMRKLKNKKN